MTEVGLGRSRAGAWGILMVASLGVFLGGAELMVVAIALPSIVADFGGWGDLGHASWIVNAYDEGGVVIAIEITLGAAIAGPGVELTGVDLSPRMLELAEKRGVYAKLILSEAGEALASALSYWGDPGLSSETQAAITAFAQSCLQGLVTAGWQKSPYKAMRQNALRMLIATSPDMQVS